MVVIRLTRGGAKKRPFYKIVVADKSRSLRGRFIEQLGYFNPIAAGKEVGLKFDLERAKHWITNGAQPTDRIKHLIKMQETTQAAAAEQA